MLLSLGLHWPDRLQRLNNLKICPLSYMGPQGLYSQQAVRVLTIRAVSRQVRSKVKAYSVFSLKPEQGYLFNFPNRYKVYKVRFGILISLARV